MGVINEGYYYPDHTEYFIGMVCEINYCKAYSEEFHPYIIKLTDGEDGIQGNLLTEYDSSDIRSILIDCEWDKNAECRVPLLTYNDLSGKGFFLVIGEYDSSDNIMNYVLSSTPRSIWLEYNHDTHEGIIKEVIFDKEDKTSINKVLYNGPLPTINHLNQLLKLLNVK